MKTGGSVEELTRLDKQDPGTFWLFPPPADRV